ncbi:MAG TPA: folylpolyglutamate synthase/dihydrofolate synthase family protein, partial [Anaerolineales bacterium]|nr:folylpolyglutamate synthase/dihydrofolate synthase family protein [Anaerolineales bacterium]
MNFQEALDFLYSFIDYGRERTYRYSPEVFDLGRVRRLLGSLGDPQEGFPSVHIAGTKGKGSVAAMIEASYRAAGYRTGLYTSPHLIRFTERIRVDGREIPEPDLVRLVERLKAVAPEIPQISTFELTTALAFLHFAELKVNCGVIEVGLGGRLDATNVLTPTVCVITSLSYDHVHLLGASLSDIAREKAGIIKPTVPLVLAPQQSEAEQVIRSIAEQRGAPLYQVNRDWHYAAEQRSLTGQSFRVWKDTHGAPVRLSIPLLGHHQIQNACTAYAALQLASERGLPVGLEAIRAGMGSVRWAGRFQVLSVDPSVVLDSAHNRDSALQLRIALDDYFPGRPVRMVFGASSDKDVRGMLLELSPRVSRVILTQADHPRAEGPEALLGLIRSFGLPVETVVPVADALRI